MVQKKKFIWFKTLLIMLMLAVLFLPSAVTLGAKIVRAVDDNASAYSKVLDDLKVDENFNIEDYPDVENDYSIKIIQVAETKGGEVIIYCYQPAAKTKPLSASKVSLSTTIYDNYSPKVYELTLLNSEGVFQKYRVDGLEVNNDMVRYYEIAEIFRPWDKDIDTLPIGDNTTSQKAINVAQRWTACTLEGQVYYNCEVTEVVEITDLFVGFVEYPAGKNFLTWLHKFNEACQSHFVAFKSNRSIDELLEADVIFTHQSRTYIQGSDGISEPICGTAVTETITLSHTDQKTVTAGTKFAKTTYSWKNIQTPTEFFSSVEGEKVYQKGIFNVAGKTTLVENDKSIISGMQYVLRFYESEWSEKTVGSTNKIKFVDETAVTDVAILRLKYVYQGETFNLGVVSDMQTGSGKSSSVTDYSVEFDKMFEKILIIVGIAILILIIVVVLNILGWLAPALRFLGMVLLKVGKFLWLIISSPFVFIGSLFKKKE